MPPRKIFKANDIRGRYAEEINEKAVTVIARALSRRYAGRVVIGHDVRISSPTLYRALKRGLSANKKLKIIEAGLITTPTLYFLVNHFGLDGGIMVTASHTPKEFNGLKVVGRGAEMISGEELYQFVSAHYQPQVLH